MKDRIKRRPWGQRAVDKAIELFEADERFMMINAFCGSGKTFTHMDIANELHRRGHIDYVLALMPRRNLCRQYELDWKEDRKRFAPPVLGQVFHRDNDPPLLRDCFFDGKQQGVATTYNSVASRLDLWESFLRDDCKGKALLILDEAQILGSTIEGDESGGTRAFHNSRRLSELARFTIGSTGTHKRSDGKRLYGGRYSAPVNGEQFLLADVDATFLEGVQEQYLRPFEFIKEDGTALREYLDSQSDDPETLVLSQMSRGMSAIIKHPSFWMPMVDRAYEELRLIRREIDPRFCMLTGACDQAHARRINDYCLKKFPDIGSLLAISDDDRALENLELFKRGRHGILNTVGMAYVGYNHPWISVVLCLGAFRHFGWLDQFAMRGGRVVDGVPVEHQVNRVIGPDDRLFCKWADMRRRDSDEGLRLRLSSSGVDGPEGPQIQERLSYILSAEMTTETALGMDPAHDLTNPKRLAEVKQFRARYQLGAVSLPGLNALLLDYGINLPSDAPEATPASAPPPSPDPAPPHPSHVTNSDRDKVIRDRLSEISKKVDGMMRQIESTTEWGWARRKTNSHFHIDSIDGLGTGRLAEILAWVEGTLYPGVLSAWNRHKSA